MSSAFFDRNSHSDGHEERTNRFFFEISSSYWVSTKSVAIKNVFGFFFLKQMATDGSSRAIAGA